MFSFFRLLMTNGAKRSFSFAWRLMLLRLGCLLIMVDAFFFFLLHSFASIFLLLFSSVLVQILVSDGDALFFFPRSIFTPFWWT